MTTDNFCFYLQNRLIQTVKQVINGTMLLRPLAFPGKALAYPCEAISGPSLATFITQRFCKLKICLHLIQTTASNCALAITESV